MTDKPGWILYIDDERIEFTGVYEDDRDDIFSHGIGCVPGMDQNTAPEDKVIGYTTSGKHVAVVAVYRNNPDGSIWGIKGIFRKGNWYPEEDGMPVFKVWDRLAQMSTSYYLVCEKHDEGVFITDNKGNPHEREHVEEFMITHLPERCPIVFRSEHYDFGRVIDWDARVKKRAKEHEEYWERLA